MKIWFSAEIDAFFQSDWFIYQPEKTIEITTAAFEELMAQQSLGLQISHNENGYPVAVEPAGPTKEEAVDYAGLQKSALLQDAQVVIGIWQAELQLGSISDDDKASLISWLSYIKELRAVDTSEAPDIKWPVSPQVS